MNAETSNIYRVLPKFYQIYPVTEQYRLGNSSTIYGLVKMS
jgi:hypothetical protein